MNLWRVLTRAVEASESKDSAIDDLSKTVSMSRDEFNAMLRQEAGDEFKELSIVHDSPWNTVEFLSFQEGCRFRQPAGKDGIASICTHPQHIAHSTGIATCSKHQCPVDPRKAK